MKTPIKLADQAVPLGTSGVRYTALAGLLSLALFTTATAADFTGSLNSVSITDSAAANKPPSAVINYTKDGNTFVFDASKSSDPDGGIVKYTWDFGDSTQALGLTAAHNFAAAGVYNISLTVVDDKGGAAITQVELNTTSGFSDDFSSDTSADYTAVTGGISIKDGIANGAKSYAWNFVIHNTTAGSTNHYAQVDNEFHIISGSGVVLGASSSNILATGYIIVPTNTTTARLYKFNGPTVTDTGKFWKISIENSKLITMKVVKSGTSFALYINGSHVSNDLSDSTYVDGQYVGLAWNQAPGYSPFIDNFKAGL